MADYAHTHFIGIGGTGLSAMARVLLERGQRVSGSDMAHNAATAALETLGATVYTGHAAANIASADLIVRSSAVPDSNPEVQAARAAGIPVLKRRDYLPHLLSGQQTVAIAGSHGKTTTTALIAWLLYHTGRDPGFIVGSHLAELDTNARHGHGGVFVIEADEYDYMFLGLAPHIAIVTNVEHDHPDLFPTLADTLAVFRQFVGQIEPTGLLLACADDPGALDVAASASAPVATYGLSPTADWRAEDIRPNPASGGSDFLLVHQGTTLGLASLRLPGLHNVRNALAALATAHTLGLTLSDLRPALRSFSGTGRRFEIKGEVDGITIVDDYAHHPTEIRATLAAARTRFLGRPIWAVFQPHTFSRTRALLLDFAASFSDADHVLVTEIYRAREADDGSIRAEDIIARMDHPSVRYVGGLDDAVAALIAHVQPGAVVLTLGAGDSYRIAERYLAHLTGANHAQPATR